MSNTISMKPPLGANPETASKNVGANAYLASLSGTFEVSYSDVPAFLRAGFTFEDELLQALASMPLLADSLSSYMENRGDPSLKVPALDQSRSLLFVGSSSEAGRGASYGPTPWMAGAREYMYPMVAVKYLSKILGLSINTSGDFGNHSNAEGGLSGYSAYDPRLSFTGAVTASAQPGMGGNGYLMTPGSVKGVTITDPSISTAILFYVSSTQPGNAIEYSVDGGAWTPYTFLNANPVALSVTGLPLGAHTLQVRTNVSNANSVQLHGFSFSNTNRPEVRGLFAGARSWNTTTTYWTATGQTYSPMAMLPIIQPSVVVDTFGGNEALDTSQDITDFIARCGTWYDAVISAGAKPLMLIKPLRSADSLDYAARDARRSLATTRGIPCLDLSDSAGPLGIAIANGELQSDNLHYKVDWHSRVGAAVGNFIFNSGILYS